MLLAFAYCYGPQSNYPELCIIPNKPDQFSCLVRVDTLIDTAQTVIRLSPNEAIMVQTFPAENTKIIEPVTPATMYLTPSQPDRPGFATKAVKVIALGDRNYEISYKQDPKEANWRPWRPHESGA